jgi:hypothetical protein
MPLLLTVLPAGGPITKKQHWPVRSFVVVIALLCDILYNSKALHVAQDWFSGGFHWQQLLYAVWEQLTGFSIRTALLCLGKKIME